MRYQMDLGPETKLSRGVVRRVWGFARAYRLQMLAFLGTIGLLALLAIIPPLLVRTLINDAIPRRSLRLIDLIGLAAIGVALANAGLSLTQRWFSARIGEGLIFDLRTALFDHVQRQPLAFFTHSQTGALISRMNNDVVGAQRALTGTLGSVASNVIGLVATLAAMFVQNRRITLVAQVVLPLFLAPARRVGKRLQEITRESMNLNAAMNTTMNERFNVAGALLVMLFGRRDRELAEFGDNAAKVRDIGIRSAMVGRTFFIALGLVGAVGTAVVYWLGARMVLDGRLQAGDVVALAAYVTQVYQPLTALTNARIEVMSAFVSFERVFEVLDHASPITDRPGARDLLDPAGRVEFDHVRFSYPSADDSSIASLIGAGPPGRPGSPPPNGRAGGAEGRPGRERVEDGQRADGALDGQAGPQQAGPVLTDVTFTAEPGELVALVGPSGAGKTTTAMLVARIYDVDQGAVRIDGVDVRDLTLESLRGAIGLVAQDPHLFHDTILANLRYAKPDATLEEVTAACRAARILDLVESLPEGWETIVGERGYRLSGGEKQRLAIARLLLADPAIVILDEATAHLDSESEVHIQEALAEALAGRTSLVIAHRLSTIVRADRILVLDRGRVVEQGTHATLLAAGGLYAELYETQFGRADPVETTA
ncbi:MAG TPA: ABC transporter ATP-binding protein [Actinomycetota bacterium]|nr:ABC transporter ATP-binding protein [Actinomycetota bacterium]